MQQISIEQSAYMDSISLMRLSKKVGELPGVKNAMVAMATDTNLRLLEESGFDISRLGETSPNNMVIAVDADGAAVVEAALAVVKQELAGKAARAPAASGGATVVKGLDGAFKLYSEIDLVLISTPGRYAAYEALKALRAGKHVMIFSDSVSLEDELRLKTFAEARDLLMMGPDCGTAIIGGAGLGFANKVPRGRIGIVAASGTGAQEVSSILARAGLGVSAIIGTGGRDVSDAIGGVMTRMGLRALVESSATDVIVIISKLPGSRVVAPLLEAAKSGGKPCVIYFAGYSGKDRDGNLTFARTLTETAALAVRLAGGRDVDFAPPERQRRERLAQLRGDLPRGGKFVRGLYSGGTLAQEAVSILAESLAPLYVNMKLPETHLLDDPTTSRGHTIVDLGDDAFTRGRAHPMIDQAYRLARLAREVEDPGTAIVLLDVVLGYGCNDDPAGEIAAALGKLKSRDTGRDKSAPRQAGFPVVVASVCGTREDPQNYDLQRQALESAGVTVAETNAAACELVRDLLRGL